MNQDFVLHFGDAQLNCMSEMIYPENFRCSSKGTAALLLSWSIFHIAFIKHRKPLSCFLILIYHYFSKYHVKKKSFFLEILNILQGDHQYCFVCGIPCLYNFQNVKCLDYSLLILICHYCPKFTSFLKILGALSTKQHY